VKSRTKLTTSDKQATPRKASVARLVPSSEPNIDDEAEERQRGGVQSLGRAFSILEEVARHREGIGLADLSKLVGLHNSTTFHLAKTLVSLGYMRQERDSKRYRVGRPLFALAASALDEIEMVNLATPILEDLSRETGESGHFAVRMGDAVVVIARTSGPGAFQLTDRVGVVRPAHCTALGKIILASLRPDQLKRFLERVELKPSTKKSITEPAALLRQIAEIRRDPEARHIFVANVWKDRKGLSVLPAHPSTYLDQLASIEGTTSGTLAVIPPMIALRDLGLGAPLQTPEGVHLGLQPLGGERELLLLALESGVLRLQVRHLLLERGAA